MTSETATVQKEAITDLMSFLQENISEAASHYEFCVKNVFAKINESYTRMFPNETVKDKAELQSCKAQTDRIHKVIARMSREMK
jgi:hypothetical protein